jgi:hypothetical protein
MCSDSKSKKNSAPAPNAATEGEKILAKLDSIESAESESLNPAKN